MNFSAISNGGGRSSGGGQRGDCALTAASRRHDAGGRENKSERKARNKALKEREERRDYTIREFYNERV